MATAILTKARNLRKSGFSLSLIAGKINTPVSTVHSWTRDIIIKPLHRKVFTDVTRKKMAESRRLMWQDAVYRQTQTEKTLRGEKHPFWMGNNVSYRSLHKWIESQLGKPHLCTHCGNKELNHRQYHWANISGLYKRKVSDWVRLCVPCHKKFDKNNI